RDRRFQQGGLELIRTLPSHVPDMLSVAAAKSVIAKEQVSLTTESVALRCALGRVLAEDVRAAVAVPPFSRAAMDGYAVRREDVACASRARPARLRVDGSIMAGSTDHVGSSPQIKATAPIGPGCARRIA